MHTKDYFLQVFGLPEDSEFIRQEGSRNNAYLVINSKYKVVVKNHKSETGFRKEIKTLQDLKQHGFNVPNILDLDENSSTLLLEFIPGHSPHELIKFDEPLPLDGIIGSISNLQKFLVTDGQTNHLADLAKRGLKNIDPFIEFYEMFNGKVYCYLDLHQKNIILNQSVWHIDFEKVGLAPPEFSVVKFPYSLRWGMNDLITQEFFKRWAICFYDEYSPKVQERLEAAYLDRLFKSCLNQFEKMAKASTHERYLMLVSDLRRNMKTLEQYDLPIVKCMMEEVNDRCKSIDNRC